MKFKKQKIIIYGFIILFLLILLSHFNLVKWEITIGEIITSVLTLLAIFVIPFYLIKHELAEERKIQREEKLRDEQITVIKNIIGELGHIGSDDFYYHMNSIKAVFSNYDDVIKEYQDCIDTFKNTAPTSPKKSKERDDALKSLIVLIASKVGFKLEEKYLFDVWTPPK